VHRLLDWTEIFHRPYNNEKTAKTTVKVLLVYYSLTDNCHQLSRSTAINRDITVLSESLSISTITVKTTCGTFWIGLCSVLRPLQYSIGYMGDSFYRSKDPTNSIKVLKEMLQRKTETTQRT